MARRPRPEPTIRAGLLLVDHAARSGTFQGLDRREVYADGKLRVTSPEGELLSEQELGFGDWLKSVGG